MESSSFCGWQLFPLPGPRVEITMLKNSHPKCSYQATGSWELRQETCPHSCCHGTWRFGFSSSFSTSCMSLRGATRQACPISPPHPERLSPVSMSQDARVRVVALFSFKMTKTYTPQRVWTERARKETSVYPQFK